MKKCFIILLLVVFVCIVSGCSQAQSGYSYDPDYDMHPAEKIEDHLLEELRLLSKDIENEFGIDPEDAARMLRNNAEGFHYSQEELDNAALAIWEYYKDSNEIFRNISSFLDE